VNPNQFPYPPPPPPPIWYGTSTYQISDGDSGNNGPLLILGVGALITVGLIFAPEVTVPILAEESPEMPRRILTTIPKSDR